MSSLAIEGTQTSLSEVLSAEAAEGTQTPEIREVRNYIRAFDYGIERLPTLPISLRLVRELHEHLLEEVVGSDRTPGEFRRSQNWIGQGGTSIDRSVFVPPPPEAMMTSLDDWERYLHEDDPKLPTLVRCALIHYQFETIHPFLDGNGRLGRLLISFYLVERGVLSEPLLHVSPYMESRRTEYYERLQRVRQRGDFEGWIGFFLDAVASQALDAVTRAETLLRVFSNYRARLRDSRIRGAAVEIVDHLLANPYVTTGRIRALLETSYQGASYAIGRLVKTGILEQAGQIGNARLYVAREILDTLEGNS